MKIGVTGALGLLGSSVVAEATSRDHEVVSIDIGQGDGVVDADVANLEALVAAFSGLDTVVHAASLIDLHLGEPPALHRVNVAGVNNVIEACRRNDVPRLVHMSSAEVITGVEPVTGWSEVEARYPAEHLTYYGVTKQAGEQNVLAAADDSLGTCAMRTYGLFGPGDNTMVPQFLQSVPGKRLLTIGDNTARTDVVYAPNLAHAMVLAAEQLTPDAEWSGGVFHVTDNPPVNIQQFLAKLTGPLGYSLMDRPRIPANVAAALAAASELPYRVSKLDRLARPPLTRHKLLLSTGDYWLNADKVRTVLGYEPQTSRAEAIDATQAWLLKSRSR